MFRTEKDSDFYDDRAGAGGRFKALQPVRRVRNMWSILIVTGWLIVSGIMDIRTRRVPVWILALGGALAVWAAFSRQSGCVEAVKGMLPGAVLVLTAFVTGKAGYGDGIVLCCLGMAMGWEKSILLFGISLFLICLCALVLLAMRRVGKNTSLPFLPFLAVAWIIVASL